MNYDTMSLFGKQLQNNAISKFLVEEGISRSFGDEKISYVGVVAKAPKLGLPRIDVVIKPKKRITDFFQSEDLYFEWGFSSGWRPLREIYSRDFEYDIGPSPVRGIGQNYICGKQSFELHEEYCVSTRFESLVKESTGVLILFGSTADYIMEPIMFFSVPNLEISRFENVFVGKLKKAGVINKSQARDIESDIEDICINFHDEMFSFLENGIQEIEQKEKGIGILFLD